MLSPPRDLFRTSDEVESESHQPLYFEPHENLTSPLIPKDDSDLVLDRTDLGPTMLDVVPQMTHAQEHEADFSDHSDYKKNATELKRKLEAIQNRSHPTIQVPMQQPKISSRNPVDQTAPESWATCSASTLRNQEQAGQQNSLQVTHDPTFTSPETMQQDEEEIMKKPGSKRGRNEPIIRAMSIDDFLTENGIDVENMLETLGLNDDVPFTVPSLDGKDNSVLDADYYQHVMLILMMTKGSQRRKKLVE
ncbi:hypothetical protein PIB30_104399 [Stylosanthes scabra]|uniref:Uncharacterized protein n=1 Tax=Stylosanthes scabra TaxID=79078 RepID=A0ABU6RYV4_9FABA|nr:hypothetical protein [Stylosanthes scabra]